MSKTLVYLGPPGTFTHEAGQLLTTNFLTEPYKLLPCTSIPEIMELISQNGQTLGIVPVENSIAGTINITTDLLAHEFDLFIQAEIILNITHHLFSYTSDLTKITTIISHPQALAQCRHFLQKYLPQATIKTLGSTAEAIRLLTTKKQKDIAAIGSLTAQEYYQVPIQSKHIGDFPHNQTRFLVLGKKPMTNPHPQKTSLIIFPLGNYPGQLYAILGVFANLQLNLCKVESQPDKKRLGSYLFLIDFESKLTPCQLEPIFRELKKVTKYYKNLGSYSIYQANPENC